MSDDASAPANVSPGDRIADYLVEAQIGQGGMAVVYRARDERLDRPVALKVLAPALAADTAFRGRFIRESRAAAAVDHPNIIPVYDAGDAGGLLFIAMRYVHGGDVRSLLADRQPLPPARAWHIISQVAAALDAAHEHGLIHRDVKPANMLLDAVSRPTSGRVPGEGEPQDHVYLSDFGISKRTVATNLTSTGQFVGTLDYIPPEQIEGRAIDGRADEYSLACAAFELLCGQPPFRRALGMALINAHLSEQPPSLAARRPGLPAGIDAVLARAMAKVPAQRYATCEQFAADLGRALGLAPGAPQAGARPSAGAGLQQPWQATELALPAAGAGGMAGAAPGAGGVAGAGESAGVAGSATEAGPAGGGPTRIAGTPGGTRGEPGTGGEVPGGPWTAGGPPAGGWPGAQQGPGWQQGAPGQYQGGQYQGGQYQQGQYQQGQYQQGQFPAGGYPPGQFPAVQPSRRRGRLLAGVLAGAVVLALAGAGLAYTFLRTGTNGPGPGRRSSGSSTSPPSSATPQAQAAAVSSLLSSSQATRGKLQPAISDIENNCPALSSSELAADVAVIRNVAMQRQSEYNQALALRTDLLPRGAELKNDLLAALQHSLDADNYYLQWAQEEQSGCFPATQSAAFRGAGNEDVQAANAKTTFTNLWNTIARKYGQPTANPQYI